MCDSVGQVFLHVRERITKIRWNRVLHVDMWLQVKGRGDACLIM